MSDLPHLRLEHTADTRPYTYGGSGGSAAFQLPPRDREPHARRLIQELSDAQITSAARRQSEGLTGEGKGEVLAIRSDVRYDLKLESLERIRSGIELVSAKIE